jgi:hypothetical protein
MLRRPARPQRLKQYTAANTLTTKSPYNVITARPEFCRVRYIIRTVLTSVGRRAGACLG